MERKPWEVTFSGNELELKVPVLASYINSVRVVLESNDAASQSLETADGITPASAFTVLTNLCGGDDPGD